MTDEPKPLPDGLVAELRRAAYVLIEESGMARPASSLEAAQYHLDVAVEKAAAAIESLSRQTDSGAEQVRSALRELIDALEDEAKTKMAAEVAADNFSNPEPELRKATKALLRVVEAKRVAMNALDLDAILAGKGEK